MTDSKLPRTFTSKLKSESISRRQLLASLAVCGVAAPWVTPLLADGHSPNPRAPDISADEALVLMKAGNQRFVDDQLKHQHTDSVWRRSLVAEQHPIAVLVGCSDSRVPPELIFDQGFGDLFVIRNAGNLIAMDVVASIEYAMVHLHSHLIVIMGHEGCGAVTAALQSRDQRETEPLELQATLKMIEATLSRTDLRGDNAQHVAAAVESNVRFGVKQLKYLAAGRQSLAVCTAKIVGAVYEMESGKVRFLK